MSRNATPGRKQINLELPPDLIDRLDARAAECGRKRTEEVMMAIERHLAAQPVATFKEAKAVEAEKPKRPRGRPPKAK